MADARSDLRREFERVDAAIVRQASAFAAPILADERARIADIVAGRNLSPKGLEGALRAAGVPQEDEKLCGTHAIAQRT